MYSPSYPLGHCQGSSIPGQISSDPTGKVPLSAQIQEQQKAQVDLAKTKKPRCKQVHLDQYSIVIYIHILLHYNCHNLSIQLYNFQNITSGDYNSLHFQYTIKNNHRCVAKGINTTYLWLDSVHSCESPAISNHNYNSWFKVEWTSTLKLLNYHQGGSVCTGTIKCSLYSSQLYTSTIQLSFDEFTTII